MTCGEYWGSLNRTERDLYFMPDLKEEQPECDAITKNYICNTETW